MDVIVVACTLRNKNQAVWNFVRPATEMTCRTVAIMIRVVLLFPCLCIRGVSLSSIHHNQYHGTYILAEDTNTFA